MTAPFRPLDGVRVVDLTRLLPGAYCTLILADLGADVVKVEDPQGGDLMRTLPPHVRGQSVYHLALNRNKRSVTLDLKAPEAADVLDRLLATADVVIESFRPGTARRLRVCAADLRARHPHLVHCSLTGFGQEGPYAERAAHDLDFVALAGLFEVDQPEAFETGSREGRASSAAAAPPPHVPRLLVADIGSAWAAATGIVAALFRRERAGRREGGSVDIAIHDVAASWLTFPAAAATMQPAGRHARLPIAGHAACYNLYTTADGRYLAVAAIEQKFWQTFCERLGCPEFVPVQFAPEEQPRMRDEIARIVRGRPLAEWLSLFADTDACLAPVNDIGEALDDAHYAFRGTVVESGESRFIRTPIVFADVRGAEVAVRTRIPIVPAAPLGRDTDEVFGAAGIGAPELTALRSRGVI